jgi:hypothetical protein
MGDLENNLTSITLDAQPKWPTVDRLLQAYQQPETWDWKFVAACLGTVASLPTKLMMMRAYMTIC